MNCQKCGKDSPVLHEWDWSLLCPSCLTEVVTGKSEKAQTDRTYEKINEFMEYNRMVNWLIIQGRIGPISTKGKSEEAT